MLMLMPRPQRGGQPYLAHKAASVGSGARALSRPAKAATRYARTVKRAVVGAGLARERCDEELRAQSLPQT
jgi:hypothetical protein